MYIYNICALLNTAQRPKHIREIDRARSAFLSPQNPCITLLLTRSDGRRAAAAPRAPPSANMY